MLYTPPTLKLFNKHLCGYHISCVYVRGVHVYVQETLTLVNNGFDIQGDIENLNMLKRIYNLVKLICTQFEIKHYQGKISI